MKFLIAASFVCLALIGQTQGGSLRGLSVITPHQQYGVPLLGNEIQTEEIKPTIVDENQAAVTIEAAKPEEPKPFVDHLPLIDSVANFGYPSGIPAFQKPAAIQIHTELPNFYIPPKPLFPIVSHTVAHPNPWTPVAISQPIQVSHAYLPPKPELPLLQPGLPLLPEVPTIEQPIQAHVELSNTYLPPKPELALLQPGLPLLPEAPNVPLAIEQPIEAHVEVSNTYLPPKPELPLLQPGLPSLPEAPIVPLTIEQPIEAHVEPSNAYLPPKTEITIEEPIESHVEISNTYLPPKPELPLLQPGLPALPEAPIIPITIEEDAEKIEVVSEVPTLPEAPQVMEEEKIGYTYAKPVPAFTEASFEAPTSEIKHQTVFQAPLIAHQPILQASITPGYISSHLIGISQASHVQPIQQVVVQPSLQAHQVLVQQPQPIQQQVLVQSSLPVIPEVSQPALETSAHHGYTYNAPKIEFLLPNQH